MAELDPTQLAVGLSVGGAILLYFVKNVLGGEKPKEPEVEEKKPRKPKKSAKTKKKEKAKAAKEKAEAARKAAAAKPKPAQPAEPAPAPSKKKKKKKEKENAAAQPAQVEEPAKKNKKKKKKAVAKAAETVEPEVAAPVAAAKPQEDNGGDWETIPIKSKKPKRTVVVDSAANGGKEDSKTMDIGDSIKVVVGPGGSTIINIQDMSGARVNTDKVRKTCTITGTPEQVNIAAQMVQNVINDQDLAVIALNTRLEQAIIRKPENLRTIQNTTGARLDIRTDENTGSITCTITGTKKKVEAAKELVGQYLAGNGPDGETMQSLKFQANQGKLIIGRKGATVQGLQNETGAQIDIQIEEPYATVTVIGSQEEVERGVTAIKNLIVAHSATTVVPLDPSAIGAVFKNLNQLRGSSDVRVDVSNDRTSIKLTGTQQEINSAKKLILGWIDAELGPPKLGPGEVLETIELGGATGKIIGKAGSNLQKLEADAPGASIKIKQGSTCYVSGKPDAVAKIKAEIDAVVSKHKETVARVQEEEKVLAGSSWGVDTTPISQVTKSVSVGAPGAQTSHQVNAGSDYGGFRLAEVQGW